MSSKKPSNDDRARVTDAKAPQQTTRPCNSIRPFMSCYPERHNFYDVELTGDTGRVDVNGSRSKRADHVDVINDQLTAFLAQNYRHNHPGRDHQMLMPLPLHKTTFFTHQ